jgi:hypothetical protein
MNSRFFFGKSLNNFHGKSDFLKKITHAVKNIIFKSHEKDFFCLYHFQALLYMELCFFS